MAVEERARSELRERLSTVLGADHAETLMAHLPSTGRAEVATRADLTLLRSELRGEMADLRGEFRMDMGRLRQDFGELRGDFGELRGEFGELRGEFGVLRGEFGELRGEIGELRGGLHAEMAKQTRLYIFTTVTALIGAVGTTAAIAFAAAGLS